MKNHTTIELSRQAFGYNIEQIKKAAGQSAIAVVVKSNAYGHGIEQIVTLAQGHPHVSWICTAGLSEAIFIRKLGIKKPLLVLSYIDASLEEAVAHDIHLMIYNREDACAFNAAAERLGKKAYAHIKIDTGMSRLGIVPDEIMLFLRALQALPSLVIYGVATHLCDTPNPDQSFSYQQLKTYDMVLDMIHAAGIPIECTHALSSSGLCLRPERSYSIIRAGAAVYGIWKSAQHRELVQAIHPDFDLMPVLHWKTNIVHLKKVPAGATVGYDRTFIARRPTVLAIAPIGYWDGYARGLSNRGCALINNQLAPIAGIVSMNLTAFDVTDIEVSLHDEISLMGPVPGITAAESAQAAHIITNEMVAHINSSLERKIVPAHQLEYEDASTASNAGARASLYVGSL